ncbi:cationic amino acid transporter 3 [Anoplophora glabripennis]|uniref:cationic amino acid transporter 3 n=1 Tax=Anoplophora glabripennis TaxID=217634 RepID=UPI000873D793|nr:cationic amino acid transporter 3 [Anoplophora glabripennis]XP_018565598.1 cationic amino acid transporter 3 [Anoplophora glabripennis]XP_023310116.1 cationic amino acid transporter 3 [Anoplophora glabripennis]
MASRIFLALTRKKKNEADGGSQLNRVLTLTDLTALGVGATLGLGVYVLAGSVAKNVAGPAVCLSFLVAAVASAVSGLCYAEFAARVPRAGSAYVYSYVSVGEFIAFIIGWNLILEYVIGTASVARGLSNYVDALADKQIRDTLTKWMPMDVSFLSPYPDLFSFGMVLLLTALLSFGVRESSSLNNVFTALNLITIVIVIVAGSIKADVANWKISVSDIEPEYQNDAGKGGFLPFGYAGIMAGAAKCFYGFVGFDAVATTGEEAKNPQRDIPLAIVISLAIIFGAYFAISTVLTMMWPYYLQDSDAPFPYVFDQIGWIAIKWVVTIGAVFALCTSMLGAMFPLPRVIYAMSSDGIIFKPLSKVNAWTKTPLLATIVSGLLSGIMAALFDLDQLIDMMSIGTLLAYTIVSVCVLILRYQVDENSEYPGLQQKEAEKTVEQTLYEIFKNIFNLNNNKYPNSTTSHIVNWSITLFSVFTAIFCAFVIYCQLAIFTEPFYLAGFIISLVAMVVLLVVMIRQPVSDVKLSFKVPLVPIIPCLSVVFNLYLMLELDVYTWIRFIVWLIIGFLIYFFYGLSHSEENPKRKQKVLASPDREVTKF